MNKTQFQLMVLLVVLVGVTSCVSVAVAPVAEKPVKPADEQPSYTGDQPAADPLPPLVEEPGFVSIFDGKTLDGWKAEDMSFWSVEDGAITGKITEAHPTERNHYLVYQGGILKDFEIKMRHRVLSKGDVNSGFQFRSQLIDWKITNDCRGYQMDNNTGTPWLVRLYDEHGRETLAWRGEKAVFNENGQKTVTPIEGAAGPARFSLGEWHEYDLICRGTTITLKVNGRLAAEVVDNDPKQLDLSGILGLQLHSGPPMTVQFKDIRIKRLD